MTTRKIKISDDDSLRAVLDARYEEADQVTLAKWALMLANHIIVLGNINEQDYPEIAEGFAVNEQWQRGLARMHDVRQAVGTGHMREHAMVASDHAVKVINLLYPGDSKRVTAERQYQLDTLTKLI